MPKGGYGNYFTQVGLPHMRGHCIYVLLAADCIYVLVAADLISADVAVSHFCPPTQAASDSRARALS